METAHVLRRRSVRGTSICFLLSVAKNSGKSWTPALSYPRWIRARKRGVTKDLRLATSAIEDAHLAQRYFHITYVDFSRALNTVRLSHMSKKDRRAGQLQDNYNFVERSSLSSLVSHCRSAQHTRLASFSSSAWAALSRP